MPDASAPELGAAPGPFVVALRSRGRRPAAAGVLVGARWVLTAAHCTAHRRVDLVPAPGIPPSTIDVRAAYRHPGFDAATGAHDLGLLELAGEVAARPISLAGGPRWERAGSGLTLFAWRLEGGAASAALRRRVVRVLPREAAERRRDGRSTPALHPSLFCATPGAWPGDSGGAVVAEERGRPLLVGVIARSGLGDLPDLHVSVATHRAWIERVLRGDLSEVVRSPRNPL